jgi:DNA processing protein
MDTDRFSIAIVGSRSASIYGKSVSERLARDLANRGLTVISGGARGVDTAAHRGVLALGGRTVAVLGCGVDVAYPPENKTLYEDIVNGGGAVISEFPLRTTPEPWRFPTRNRIISGMSLGTVVVESPEESGALITATCACEQGREVFAVPGNVDSPRNRGCHRLIKEGAKLVETADDILDELGIEHAEQPQLPFVCDGLTCAEKKLVDLLSLQPKHMDQIITESGLPAHEVAGHLTLLEMRGLVKRVPGNAYVRSI